MPFLQKTALTQALMRVTQVKSDYSMEITERARPALPQKGALVRMTACGLCGSDLDKLLNHKASTGTVLGHEVVGIIEQLDENHGTPFRVGDRIVSAHHVPCGTCHYCLNGSESMCREFKSTNFNPGGFSEVFSLSQRHLEHVAFPVPDTISDDEASCTEPLACVLKAIRRGGSFLNGSVAVIGLGFIGMMASQVYQNQGYSVYGVDLNRSRLNLAKAQGFVQDAFHPVEDLNALKQTLERQAQEGPSRLDKVDLVFLSVVTPQTLKLALELVRDSGTMVLFSSALEAKSLTKAMIDPSVLYFREISLIPSYSPALQDLNEASRMIFNREIKIKPLCTHHRSLSQLQDAVELYKTGNALKVIITP